MDHTESVTKSLRDHLFNGFAALERDEGLCAYKSALLNHANRMIAGDACRFSSSEIIGNHVPELTKLFGSVPTKAPDLSACSPTQSPNAHSLRLIAERVIEEMDIIRIEVDVFNGSDSSTFYDLELIVYSDSCSISCESSPCPLLNPNSKTTLPVIIHRSNLPLSQSTISASIVLSYSTNQDCGEALYLPGRCVSLRRWWSSTSNPEFKNSSAGIRKEYTVRAGIFLSSETQSLLTLPSLLSGTLNFVGFDNIDSKPSPSNECRTFHCSRDDIQVELHSLGRCDAQMTISSFCQNRICSALNEILHCYPDGSVSVSIDWSAPCYFQWTAKLASALRLELQQTDALLHDMISRITAHGGAKAPDPVFSDLQNEYLNRFSQLHQLQSSSDLLAARVVAISDVDNELK